MSKKLCIQIRKVQKSANINHIRQKTGLPWQKICFMLFALCYYGSFYASATCFFLLHNLIKQFLLLFAAVFLSLANVIFQIKTLCKRNTPSVCMAKILKSNNNFQKIALLLHAMLCSFIPYFISFHINFKM